MVEGEIFAQFGVFAGPRPGFESSSRIGESAQARAGRSPMARLPADQANAASRALEEMFIEADACELVSESKRSAAMNKHVDGKKLFESISKLSDPASKINKIKSWVEPAGARLAGKAFEAISKRDMEALRVALSDWRSSGGSVDSLSSEKKAPQVETKALPIGFKPIWRRCS